RGQGRPQPRGRDHRRAVPPRRHRRGAALSAAGEDPRQSAAGARYLLLGDTPTRDAVEQKARNETVANSVGHEIGRFILAGARSLALDSNGDSAPAGQTHGLFTTYLLKGLDGEADLQHNGRINVAELLMFTKSRVREESAKLNLDQEPFFYFSGSNFFEIRAVAVNR